MHFGEEDSLLTGIDPLQPSPVAVQLVECLKHLIGQNEDKNNKPTLILNGDILELALSTTNNAAIAFECFIKIAMPSGEELFDNILYIPGNHDHHLWERARETQYVKYIETINPGTKLNHPWHTTRLLDVYNKRVPSYFLTRLVQRFHHLENFVIRAAYPNMGIDEKWPKCIVFHHGHFIEPLYYLMSILKSHLFDRKIPEEVWDIEAENFAWIDFFWSTMGRSGEVGQEVEIIYEKMQSPEQFKKLLHKFVDNLNKKHDLPGWDRATAWVIKKLLDHAVDRIVKTERTRTDIPLSDDAKDGLQDYIEGPLKKQLLRERKEVPSDFTFILGHTHKPFQEEMPFNGYQQQVNVYNTGGWVVETVDPQPIHGGAVVLVDENMNTISLRMYNDEADPSQYSAKVEATDSDMAREFYRQISGMVDPSKDPWKAFSETTFKEVKIRRNKLIERINKTP
jgi:UDP-2,3-diacylglucosamine pyrophosphatase LpxH